jgi:hypothetical protein
MYPLGKFTIDERRSDLLRSLQYHEEPMPAAIRGAMNPWVQERQRALRLAEDAAWKSLGAIKVQVIPLYQRYEATLPEFNRKLAELEGVTGQKGGGVGKMLTSTIMMPFSMIGGLFGGGKKKKQRAEQLQRDLTRLEAELLALQSSIDALHQQAIPLIGTAVQIKGQQDAQQADVLTQSPASYETRRSLDVARGKELAELNRFVAQSPLYNRPRGGYADAL